MKNRSIALGLLAGVAVLGPVNAAEALEWHAGSPHSRFPGSPVDASHAFLRSAARAIRVEHLDLQPDLSTRLRSMHTVRFAQRYHGLPVFGSGVAVRVDHDGTIRTVAVDVARHLSVSPIPTMDEAAARAVVSARVGRPVDVAAVELGVRPHEGRGGLLVWRLDVMLGRGAHRFEVDAHTGRLLQDYPLSRSALGRVYAVNPSKTPTLVDVELPGLDVADPSRLDGFDNGLSAFAYASGDMYDNNVQVSQDTGPNEGSDFLYEPNPSVTSPDDPFGEVMAYYHAARMRRYFEDTFALDLTGNKYSLAVVASYAPPTSPEYIGNAFYSPAYPGYADLPEGKRNGIFLGRGNSKDLSYDSDVLLHEFTHYVNHNAMSFGASGIYDQWGFLTMPGALDEGTADYFSSTNNDDPVVGEFALDYDARDLSAPAGRCPDNVWGESHEDGKLVGTTGWAMREALGAEVADDLMWGSMTMLGSSASLGDFATGILQTADDLGLAASDVQQIEAILAQRGLDDCGRALQLNDGSTRTTSIIGLEFLGYYYGASCSQMKGYGMIMTSTFQFLYTPHGSEDGIRFEVDLQNMMGGGALDWSLFVRRNEMVTLAGYNGYDAPTIDEYDYKIEDLTSNHGEIVIDKSSSPKFDKLSNYYMLIVAHHCPMVSASVKALPVTEPGDAGPDAPVGEDAGPDAPEPPADAAPEATADAAPPVVPDAGPTLDGGTTPSAEPEDIEAGGGCGCRTTSDRGAQGGALAWLAFGAAIAVARRRRR